MRFDNKGSIKCYRYIQISIKIGQKLHGPGDETLALFVPRRSAVKIRLNKKCREKPNYSLVFIISLGDVFFMFDLCKLYRSLDILICIQRWLKMPHLKIFSVH